jgi:predicted nucleic acid-binding protein
MTERFFVDSNVLVYARDVTEPAKQAHADLWLRCIWAAGTGRLSYQVLVESYSALTAPSKRRMQDDEARTYVASFDVWRPTVIDMPLLERAWQVQNRYGFSWWDCLIVASAQLQECSYLLTEDLQHDQNLDGVMVIDPFQVEPEKLIAV